MCPGPRVLFYPCCGDDIEEAIVRFVDSVDVFWFVNLEFVPCSERNARQIRSNEDGAHGLATAASIRPIGRPSVRRDPEDVVEYRGVTHSDSYLHAPTMRPIVIHRRRGEGVDTFQRSVPRIDVFYYRGDRPGEGGSGKLFLGREIFEELILLRLVRGGLVVTDGSQCEDPFTNLAEFHPRRGRKCDEPELAARPFNALGLEFICVGRLGDRYGPTLIWRVE